MQPSKSQSEAQSSNTLQWNTCSNVYHENSASDSNTFLTTHSMNHELENPPHILAEDGSPHENNQKLEQGEHVEQSEYIDQGEQLEQVEQVDNKHNVNSEIWAEHKSNGDQNLDSTPQNTSSNPLNTSHTGINSLQNTDIAQASIPNFRKKRSFPPGLNRKNRQNIPLHINLPKPNVSLTSSGTYHTPSIEIKATGITQMFDFSKFDMSSGILGRGVSSVVLRAIYKDPESEYYGKKYAIKVVELKSMHNSVIENEIHSIMNLKSDYIVNLYDAYSKEGCINMVLEYMEFGSLEDVCNTVPNRKIPNNVLREIAGQLTMGLAYLESNRTIHRDIKPANCLLNKKGACKLGDFGFSRRKDNGMDYFQTYQGSLTYMSPERIQGKKYSYNADVWSLGLTILECILGRYPFSDNDISGEGLNHWQAQQLIEEGLRINSQEVPSDLEDFVRQCTIMNPDERPLATQLINHPYLVHNSTSATKKWIKNVVRKAKMEKIEQKKRAF